MNIITERRNNWKASLAKAAVARRQQRKQIMIDLDALREDITKCGTNFSEYDQLKLQQRVLLAKLHNLQED